MTAEITIDLGPASRAAGKVCESCARCKVKIAMTPKRVREMERGLSAMVRALDGDHEGEG